MPRQLKLPGMPEPQPRGTSEPTEPEKLRDIAARAPMRIMAPLKGVHGIVADRQFKTQHETGTAGPQATLNPTLRAMYENTNFGPGQRPVYGYFSHGDVRDVTRSTAGLGDPNVRYDEVSGYGHTAFQLGEHMRKHTTYSWGDTLGSGPEEITKQGALPTTMLQGAARRGPEFNHADSFYTEMHVHKRPSLGDVTQAIIYETEDPNNLRGPALRQTERTAMTQAVLIGGKVPHEVRKVGMGGQMALPLELEDWGSANWKKVGEGEPGKDIERQGWSGSRYAFETPRDEQRPMVSVRDKWRPNRASP